MLLGGMRPWLDPTVTSIGRLPIRPPLVPFPDEAAARHGDPAGSPWFLDLDGEWDFELLDRPEAVSEAHLGGLPLSDTIDVPGAWTLQDAGIRRGSRPHYTNVVMPFDADPPAVPEENPTGVYRRGLSVPRAWGRRRVVLRVGAAESAVLVFVDGAFVGMGTDSRLPSEFDLTPHVQAGRRHTLALVVVKWSAGTWLEDQDQWWHGGPQREVTLYSTAASYLATALVLPTLAEPPTAPLPADGHTIGRLEVTATVGGPALRAAGHTFEVGVETLRGRSLATTGAMEVPVWPAGSPGSELLGGMYVEAGTVRASLDVDDVLPWSAESPRRYRALLTLRSPDGAVVECSTLTLGFRSVEVRDRQLLVNGAPVRLHGVNVHEHDPQGGRWVRPELAREDLLMVKSANLNAVRAAHYPHHERFAEMCDELGLFLVDEADVETHARQTTLCHDPRFAGAIVERVERMVRRDAHHPSVILWSLGNESGYGAAHDAAAATVRRIDPSRPLHYEGPLMHDLYDDAPVTDVVCPMYRTVGEIREWARRAPDRRRPLILCEYAHAMGNSLGGLADYVDAFDTVHGLQGGFIWEWLEHGLELPDHPGHWGYGGDFGDEPNDGDFVCDGLVDAGRRARPALTEVAHLGRPVRTSLRRPTRSGAELALHNQRWFTDTSDLAGEWELTVDGDMLGSGALDAAPVAPRTVDRVALGWPPDTLARLAARNGAALDGSEPPWLTVRWRQRRATPWHPSGAVVGADQMSLAPSEGRPRRRRGGRPPDPSPELVPAPLSARLTAAIRNPAPTLFRALTDNDGIRAGWMRGFVGQLRRWVDEHGLDAEEWQPTDRDPASGSLRTTAGNLEVRCSHRLEGDWERMGFVFILPEALADPPRLGVRFELPADLEDLEWLGDGPGECYPDRRAAATVGRWRSTVSAQYEPYVMPQEHGHHTGLRWVVLRSAVDGLLVVAEPHRNQRAAGQRRPGFSARAHTDAELWAARHTSDLSAPGVEDRRGVQLAMDVAQRGLGTASCGPDTAAPYRIQSGRHELVLWVTGLAGTG